MTPAALRALADLLKGDTDILCEGRTCYCGNRPIARGTVRELLLCTAIREDRAGGSERYEVNESLATQILARPALANEITAAILAGSGPFTIRNSTIIPLDSMRRPTHD